MRCTDARCPHAAHLWVITAAGARAPGIIASMNTLHIATACFVNDAHELLVVRKQNTRKWMLPGGKLAGAETPEQASLRELQEELHLTLTASSLTPLGYFQAVAANEPDTQVQAHVFAATLPPQCPITIAAEIAALQWMPLEHALHDADVAPMLREHVIPALQQRLASTV